MNQQVCNENYWARRRFVIFVVGGEVCCEAVGATVEAGPSGGVDVSLKLLNLPSFLAPQTIKSSNSVGSQWAPAFRDGAPGRDEGERGLPE